MNHRPATGTVLVNGSVRSARVENGLVLVARTAAPANGFRGGWFPTSQVVASTYQAYGTGTPRLTQEA